MGRNRTGPPCSVGLPTAHATGGRPARPPAALLTTTDDRRPRAKQYKLIRRASNKRVLFFCSVCVFHFVRPKARVFVVFKKSYVYAFVQRIMRSARYMRWISVRPSVCHTLLMFYGNG